jgi:hypothetical protein
LNALAYHRPGTILVDDAEGLVIEKGAAVSTLEPGEPRGRAKCATPLAAADRPGADRPARREKNDPTRRWR